VRLGQVENRSLRDRMHFNIAVFRKAEISLDIESITFRICGDLEECDTAWPEPLKDAVEERTYDRWRIVLEDEDAEDDINRRECIENLDPRRVHEFDVLQFSLSYLGPGQLYMWKRNVARHHPAESPG
jgi:hypothetical protein